GGGRGRASGGAAGVTAGERRSTLFLELSALAAEQAKVDCLVVAFFSDERPLRESAGRADWRLCGRLSQLLAAGRLTGRRGEAVLVASSRRVAAAPGPGARPGPR